MDQDQVKRNVLSGQQWLRMLFMAGYILASWVLTLVLLVTILIQTLIVLITGDANHNLRRFGILCGVFMHQIIHFLVYGSDDKPFPFSDFPDIDKVDASDNFAREETARSSYQSGSTGSMTDSDYDDIAAASVGGDADDDFPPATDTDPDPERLS